jgi:hypothetical protein
VLPKANSLADPELKPVWDAFSKAAFKYKRKYGKTPVLIIDNSNKLSDNEGKLLDSVQNRASLLPMKEMLPSCLCQAQAAYHVV